MADLVFDAATSATSAAADNQEEEKSSHVFGAIPYERVLSIAECKRLERSEQRLHDRLDQIVHLWVRDAHSFRHGRPSDVHVAKCTVVVNVIWMVRLVIESVLPFFYSPSFSLRLHLSLPIAESRDMIQEQFAHLSAYNEAADGALHLVHNGRVLENGNQLAEYVVTSKSPRSSVLEKRAAGHALWFRPFAGIIWVVPSRSLRSTPIEWGNGAFVSPS
ncbi:hypothetical protein FI667_g12008, partial [Globisporangium splendens]